MDDKEDKISSKNQQMPYYCVFCDYYTCRKGNMSEHLMTAKHRRMTQEDKNQQNPAFPANTKNTKQIQCDFVCECGKIYRHRQGLWKHRKTCMTEIVDQADFDQNFSDKELIKILVNQNDKLMKMLESGTNNINCNNTSNSHNKSFNLNLFLNETCKDAMNISDFISSIKVNLEDLENTGRKGYIEGISNIFLKNLNKLEQHMRPLHCSDLKREVLYIKDNDKWEKESEQKPILIKAIKTVANENIKQIKNWREKHPNCTDSESKNNNLYLKIVSNSMNGLTEEEGRKNINKIISNVAKEVIIDKNDLNIS